VIIGADGRVTKATLGEKALNGSAAPEDLSIDMGPRRSALALSRYVERKPLASGAWDFLQRADIDAKGRMPNQE
jgi:hypothetical protein